MTNEVNEKNREMKLTNGKVFSEDNFVSLLLPLLQQYGVNSISEQQLLRKLYCFYRKDEYKELFQDIVLLNNTFNEMVDIHDGLNQAKLFGGNIVWDQMNPDTLILLYAANKDLSFAERFLSEDGKTKMRKMANILATCYKVERSSEHHIYFLNTNPNDNYLLVKGRSLTDELCFDLITDGEVETIEHYNAPASSFYQNPIYPLEFRGLRQNKVTDVLIKDATYTIKQGLCNDKICYGDIRTNIIDREKLEQIRDIANERCDNAIISEAPYVKRRTL